MPRFRVDLRSDTVSTPSPPMRSAMAGAEVGDAWYGDDPIVNRLQERAAELIEHLEPVRRGPYGGAFGWLAPAAPVAGSANEIKGDGWTLVLNPPWSLRADSSRPGSFVAAKDR